MLTLNQLGNNSRKARKRVGRGIGSGTGKTSGRGHKGQKSRAGASVHGFEGGQMPIYRALPKRGFKNPDAIAYQVVNIDRLQHAIDLKKYDTDKPITKEAMLELGIIGKKNVPVKILGKGKIKTPVTIEAEKASSAALKAIEKAGGKITLIQKKQHTPQSA